MSRPATNFDLVVQQDGHSRELQDVFTERVRQLRKFGPQNRPPFEWFLILSEEVGEVAKECVEIQFDDAAHPHADPERYYKELTEVVAVGLAAMQNFNQRRVKPACAHPEDEGGCSLCTTRVGACRKCGEARQQCANTECPGASPFPRVFPPACSRCTQRRDECLCPPMFPREEPPF